MSFNAILENIILAKISEFTGINLSLDVAAGSDITPCNKTDEPLLVYRFTGNVMTSITTLRKQ